AARRARWQFLESLADELGASRIATGHTQDDHIETILLNILRGTGIDGLRGLAPLSGRRARPLLPVTRAETADYCRAHAIPFREDASNTSYKYLRNRVRAELLPELAAYYNPAIREALLRLAGIASEQADYMRAQGLDALNATLLNAE